MAWGGKYQGRMSDKQRKHFFRTSNRSLPQRDPPSGIPTSVMRQLAQENLTSDPVLWNRRLAELLNAYEKNGG